METDHCEGVELAILQQAFADLGGDVVLKACSEAFPHKSEHGLVLLSIRELAELRTGYLFIRRKLIELGAPDAGVLVAEAVKADDRMRLVLEPDLSVVLFEVVGWNRQQYFEWSRRTAAEGRALINPVEFEDRTCLRICVVNPLTDAQAIIALFDDFG